ncbi:MAG: alanine racemase, partial [Dehalococcoidales bacterium]|nr:alanine racemase [Dehalococcoidales bacterium]
MTISDKVKKILHSLPPGVELEAAAKGRPGEAVQEAIAAGICIIGENYLQEAEKHYQSIGNGISWHFIGHLQKNKVKKAIALFDMIETIDSLSLAEEINNKCRTINKVMPVLIEINSGHEPQKHGVFLEDAPSLVYDISGLSHIRVTGLMTMGPVV